ncbi:methionine ABC transporter ATP-binding protein [Salipaludibacillus agaradhaerens]|uniref:Methionine ABC transporter ATP-binding protein n=1 Tax=Salipaludibacillus agaradhaerens TaxID=76935 RepID=A0A9Q4AYH2_SALAG|nr:methionine ABC transporter ATP-binding protein [Salipaludibacillus agaradhaerens]MCR6095211.1 methionine ABC transporter ATP-binding protein [Salipaludibacillus agaradhaerens]MCR6115231.1 methionine ABC transporter ATP-binding protein [Salipaludibacillus agaradhaerens]
MISLQKIAKTFQTKDGDVTAVDHVDLTVDEGEIFGIIGYSGAGKSTLIRLLNMLETPSSGDITVAGKNMTTLTKKELRKARQEIGMIFQHFNLLWSRTVEENIAFPLEIKGVSKGEKKKRVQELITLVGLEGRGGSYPAQLSGGQKQRVGIARALATNPKVLLCDEATSALDPKTTDSILDLLVDINKKLSLTIILITHEMHVIRKICHRVAVMENGQIVEEGPVLDVFRSPKEDMTKEFVKQVTEPEETEEAIAHLFKDDGIGHVLQLTFVGSDAKRSLITDVVRRFDISISILQGKISQTRDGSYGSLFVNVTGEKTVIEEAITYIKEQKVDVEVIHYV